MEDKNAKCHLMGKPTLITSKSLYKPFPSSPFSLTHYFSILMQPC